jgi:hypothetical protein
MSDVALFRQILTQDLLAEAEKQGYTFTILAKPVHPSLLLEAAVKALTGDIEKLSHGE